jgi:hypothetical protein
MDALLGSEWRVKTAVILPMLKARFTKPASCIYSCGQRMATLGWVHVPRRYRSLAAVVISRMLDQLESASGRSLLVSNDNARCS